MGEAFLRSVTLLAERASAIEGDVDAAHVAALELLPGS